MALTILILAQTLRNNVPSSQMDLPQPKVNIVHHAYSSGVPCEEAKSIYYLKVHKTGSTTFSSILHGFGLRHNLTFAWFERRSEQISNNMLDYLIPHPLDLIHRTQYQHKLDIVSIHNIFNKLAIDKIMPHTKKLVATVRHPFEQFKSAFNYFHLDNILDIRNTSDPFREFLEHPDKYEKLVMPKIFNKGEKLHTTASYTRNLMAFEFGFDLNKSKNKTYIDRYLNYLEQIFDIVVPAEYFDEALLLMKRKFCWTLKDILYLPLRNASASNMNLTSSMNYSDLQTNHQIQGQKRILIKYLEHALDESLF